MFRVQLLLGYLPPDPSEWDEVLARKRTEYLLFCEVSCSSGHGSRHYRNSAPKRLMHAVAVHGRQQCTRLHVPLYSMCTPTQLEHVTCAGKSGIEYT